MRLAGPLHPEEEHIVGQAFLVARMRDRVQRRFILESRRRASLLLDAKHSGYVCRQPGEQRSLLIETIRQSLARKRLTVLLHGMESNRAMLEHLHGERLPEDEAKSNQALLLVPANLVWEAKRPDPAATLEFVDELHALGQRLAHPQVQLISDANNLFTRKNDERILALEEWWNRAKVHDVNLTCLYRSNDLVGFDAETIQRLHEQGK